MSDAHTDDTHTTHDPPRANLSDLTGVTLGKYRLIEKLGQGGMAQVYRAHQADLDRYVAIKILHPHLTGDEEFAARFQREARAIAALEHPHIVRVYDFATDHGVAFLVMEFLDGANLKTRVRELNSRRERMDLREVAHIIGAIADALAHAHRHGVVHRDVKPSNVILARDDRPVLSDFGIARMVDAPTLTASGSTLGTPAYLSPEQARGEPGDARSDIYALGVILYQLCTGHLPFDADTPYAIILKHLTAPLPPPRALRPDLPVAFERVILKALAKDPAARYQTASEMGAAIRAALAAPAHLPARTFSLRWFQFAPRQLPAPLVWIVLTLFICIGLFIVSRPWRIERFVTRTGTPAATEAARAILVLQGAGLIEETWLDPDAPDAIWRTTERAALRGARGDRILIAFNLARLPADATNITATLALRAQALNPGAPPGQIAAYRLLTPWKPQTATYNFPWGKPGLASDQDYDATPVGAAMLTDAETLSLDVTPAITQWLSRGRTGGGLLLKLNEDSPAASAYWIYTTDHPDATARPTLRVQYKAGP